MPVPTDLSAPLRSPENDEQRRLGGGAEQGSGTKLAVGHLLIGGPSNRVRFQHGRLMNPHGEKCFLGFLEMIEA